MKKIVVTGCDSCPFNMSAMLDEAAVFDANNIDGMFRKQEVCTHGEYLELEFGRDIPADIYKNGKHPDWCGLQNDESQITPA